MRPVNKTVFQQPASRAGSLRPVVRPGLHEQRGRFLRIDVPANPELESWLTERGLKPAGPATTMARGEWPAAPGPARLYGLISQSLG